MGVSGDDLYSCIISDSSENKVALLSELKRHVKKDNVRLTHVPKYFESLSIVMDSNDSTLQTLAFSLICHLVKRVSIQDNDGVLLLEQSFLVLPILIPKLADPKQNVKIAAGRALEAYWLSASSKVDSGLIDFGLSNRNPLVVNECIVWINHILTTINPYLKLDTFFDVLASTLKKYESQQTIVENIKTLFANYYDLKHNNLRKFELQRVLETHNVNTALRRSIMGTDDIISREVDPKPPVKKNVQSGALEEPERPRLVVHLLNKRSSPSVQHSVPLQQFAQEDETIAVPLDSKSSQLENLLSRLPNYAFDNGIAVVNVSDQNQIYKIVTEMLPNFENKESEKNWLPREKSILKLRSLLRGNAPNDYPQVMITAIKEIAEGICKGLLSLRTTLNVNSCQLVKDMTFIFGDDFDPLAEVFFPTLMRLCSATKHLTTTNAHVVVCAILSNCAFHPRLMHKIVVASSDKSATTRSYSAFWMQIMILRFSDTEQQKVVVDVAEKVLPKLLSDPSSQVRQAAKEAYKKYNEFLPQHANELLKGLDANVLRALERSLPESLGSTKPSLLLSKRKPSLKESIIAKNKELKNKRTESRSSSRNLPRRPTDNGVDGPDNLQPEHATSTTHKQTRISSHPSLSLLSDAPAIPHYAQSTFSQRFSSNPVQRTTKHTADHAKDLISKTKSSPEAAHRLLSNRVIERHVPFNKKTDPLIKFLSSNQDEFILEGVNLLRYAIIGDEDLTEDVLNAIRRISITNPQLLRPLFSEGDNLLNKTKSIFSSEDFMRLCAILLSLTERVVNTIISVMDVDVLYATVSTLVSYITDLDNIVDDKLLVMQVIKFKNKILDMLLNFLLQASAKIPISDVNFAKLTANLFDLVPIVHSTSSYDVYKALLKRLYSINSVLFTTQLSTASKVSKSEIEQFVGIDNILYFNGKDTTLFNAVSELTEIAPGHPNLKMSPLKNPSDFTMLMPVRSESDGAILIQDAEMEKYGQRFKAEDNDSIATNSPGTVKEEPPWNEKDVFMEDSEPGLLMETQKNVSNSGSKHEPLAIHDLAQRNSIHMEEWKHNKKDYSQETTEKENTTKSLSSLSSNELADDFAQVKLTNPTNTIQTFIEKVDPLSKLSSKNKPIFIFEDCKMGSPEKAKEYSYSELNWFNFLVAKLSLESHFSEGNDQSIEEFKMLCKELDKSTVNTNQLTKLLMFIQGNQSAEFSEFYDNEGYQLLERSLWASFQSTTFENQMNLLLVLKQIFISRKRVDLGQLWQMLLLISSKGDTDPLLEMMVAIGEVFDEALRSSFSSGELTTIVLDTLRDSKNVSQKSTLFALECLLKLMSVGTLTLKINKDLVTKLRDILNPFINHHDTEMRKLAFQIYGRIMRAVSVSEISNRVLSPEKSDKGLEDEILKGLSGPQKRLVEYFSHLSV